MRNSLLKLNNAFDSLILKHEASTSLITDDDEFDKEEKWLAECQEYFLRIDLEVETYIESVNVEISDRITTATRNDNLASQGLYLRPALRQRPWFRLVTCHPKIWDTFN